MFGVLLSVLSVYLDSWQSWFIQPKGNPFIFVHKGVFPKLRPFVCVSERLGSPSRPLVSLVPESGRSSLPPAHVDFGRQETQPRKYLFRLPLWSRKEEWRKATDVPSWRLLGPTLYRLGVQDLVPSLLAPRPSTTTFYRVGDRPSWDPRRTFTPETRSGKSRVGTTTLGSGRRRVVNGRWTTKGSLQFFEWIKKEIQDFKGLTKLGSGKIRNNFRNLPENLDLYTPEIRTLGKTKIQKTFLSREG